MTARLIAITKPVDGEFGRTAEELISYCARVSNPTNQANFDTAPKLLNFCIRNKHWSIFEAVNVVIEIETTRDIARQILRHRSFHFQEFSQRYADPTTSLGFVTREARLQDAKNRQNSIEVSDGGLQEWWTKEQEFLTNAVNTAYKRAIELGIAKEQARAILPEGLTMSRMYMNGTLRDWIHYCSVRRGNGTQKEHQIIANECWDILTSQFEFLKTIEE